jgi:hypothetical protein
MYKELNAYEELTGQDPDTIDPREPPAKPGKCTLDHVCAEPYTLCPTDPCQAQNVPQDEDGVEWELEDVELTPQDRVCMKRDDGTTFELPMESFIQNVKRMLDELTELDRIDFGDEFGDTMDED